MAFGRLPRRGSPAIPLGPATPAAPQTTLAQRLGDWLTALDWHERECSAYVSPAVFSRLRAINDLFRQAVPALASRELFPEDEYLIRTTLTQYIPDALALFNRLPPAERYPGGPADLQLLEQCENFQRSAQALVDKLVLGMHSDLEVQTDFVDERFRDHI